MRSSFATFGLFLLAVSGCRQDMYNQPRAKTYSQNDFFEDATSARPLSAGTVEYHGIRESEAVDSGLTDGVFATQLPPPLSLTAEFLERGRQRYDIYCAACHGFGGNGDGEVVQRGFPAPPTFHSPRLREAPLGQFFEVVTHGYGVMYPFAAQVEPNDRWAIVAYVRALQLSRNALPGDLSPNERRKLEAMR